MSGKIGPAELQPVIIGAALAVSIFVGGKISGGHFNPAVSVMMARAGKLKMADLVPYVAAQVLGGLVALELSKHIKFIDSTYEGLKNPIEAARKWLRK